MLRVHRPDDGRNYSPFIIPDAEPERTRWVINGHPATIEIWRPGRFRPQAAAGNAVQFLADGSAVSLRIE